ncbi:unnamed protein product (macronuclear) [Paramecium tetraurelia]|uniref:Uncharacterized protein n=1 Tax=Paramecium tetraurelia TaxID=5888 RepID=A0CVU5_PARTE|nr:uncharacterized protein GSPATT00001114001 [Paramecium tetraurelia]CAK74912.1 unnamed protein product [Paramecium tetraurelia]|eukprot:XP_001442309.1 hypothetical protein (macronuclear) [Paramecium tetraurelia strain d4-2]
MYFKLLLDSQAVSTKFEVELKSYQITQVLKDKLYISELLLKTPLFTQQQIQRFAEPKVSINLRKYQDQEDARLILEARNQQIWWLKNLIKESKFSQP